MVAFFVGLSFTCYPLSASAIELSELELYPTYSAVGLEVSYDGDDDDNSIASFVWREKGETVWRNGVDMTHDRSRKLIWASIWPLQQGITVEVKVTSEDNGRTATIQNTTRTRKLTLENSGGNIYYVSPSGSDENPGTKLEPFATLTRGAKALQTGDTLLAMSGVYREGNLFSNLSGTPQKPIIIGAAHGERPILDSSASIEKGFGQWQAVGNDIYVTRLKLNPDQRRYAAQDGLRMFFYRSLDHLDKDELKAQRAWFYDEDAGRIYVRTGHESTPDKHEYRVANHTYAVNLTNSNYVVVRGFEMQYYGEVGVNIKGSSRGCVIYENVIHSSPGAVNISGREVHDTAVWHNKFYDKGLNDFTWNAIKASEYRRQGLTCFSGRGSSICYNYVDGFFDGIDPEVWKHTAEIQLNRDLDVMYNDFINCGDDAIEADGGGVNYRIHGNRMRNVFAAISIAPVEKGPVYVTRNHASFKMLMFKLNVGGPESLGWAYCYHNSGYSQVTGEGWGGFAISFPPAETLPISNKVFANNAVVAKGTGIRCAHEGYRLDYDCFYHVPGEKPLAFSWQIKGVDGQWQDRTRYRALKTFAEATGREQHGIYADPMFISSPDVGTIKLQDFGIIPLSTFPLVEDSSVGDLRLQRKSPCIDAGVVIRGINEDYNGEAPDIGAFEYLR